MVGVGDDRGAVGKHHPVAGVSDHDLGRKCDPARRAGLVEDAELDPLRMGREDRDVDPVTVDRDTQRLGLPLGNPAGTSLVCHRAP